MAQINRSDVIQKAVNDLALQPAVDKIPSETLDKVQLTYDLNKRISTWCLSNTSSATGTLTLTMFTIDTRSEIYITSLDFDMIKDATCDQATGALSVLLTTQEQNISKTIVAISTITLTAQTSHVHVDFAYPLKLKPNTNITTAATYSVGVMVRSLSATGIISSTN